jgi:integrase/recombinase XerD
MSTLAPILQGFFTGRLIRQRQASDHTITAYRNTFRLLLRFAWQQTGRQPAQLTLDDLDAPLIGAFLHHLETDRDNSVTTRNARLAAIHSLFRHAALQAPDHAALIQRVLAIPAKRTDRTIVCYLTHEEMQALLAAPSQNTWHGRRDHALLALAGQTGLRVSELTGLKIRDIHLTSGPHVCCHGKGRKDRITPLTGHTTRTLRAWLTERHGTPGDPLFPSRRGTPLSTDAVEHLVAKHATTAAATCTSLQSKKVTPHTLRHSAAMALLHSGVDISVIALWLGHESSQTSMIYLHADMTLKEQALARLTPPTTTPGRYTPPDTILAFLDSL